MKDDSHCRKAKYCDFVVTISNDEVQVEVCQFCGKKVGYWKEKGTGRIDNAKYLRDHVRHFCQPFGPTRKIFEEIYGRNVSDEFIKELSKKRKERKTHQPRNT